MARTRKPRVVDLTRRITHEMPNFPASPAPDSSALVVSTTSGSAVARS